MWGMSVPYGEARRRLMRRLIRIDHFCPGCGTQFYTDHTGKILARNGQTVTLDHIIPRGRGGRNANWNFRLMCRACNEAKGVAAAELFDGSMRPPPTELRKRLVGHQAERE